MCKTAAVLAFGGRHATKETRTLEAGPPRVALQVPETYQCASVDVHRDSHRDIVTRQQAQQLEDPQQFQQQVVHSWISSCQVNPQMKCEEPSREHTSFVC